MSVSLRVVSYNLLHGMHLARRGAIDLDAVAEVIAPLEPDVVALQEVDRDQVRSGRVDQTAHLADLLGMHGVFCAALHGSPDDSWTPPTPDAAGLASSGPAYGVGLLSRHPFSQVRRIALPGGGAGSRGPNASLRNPGWDREPRVALSAQVGVSRTEDLDATDPPSVEVEMVVTHLSYMPWRAVHQLRTALAGVNGSPALLIGDLNLPAVAVRSAMPAAWNHAGGDPTFPAWRPRLQMHHVLVRGGVTVAHAAVHPMSTSDHLPLVVDLLAADAPGAVEEAGFSRPE